MLEQIKAKAIPIAKALYPEYELLFMFDNLPSYAFYTKNILEVAHINKGLENQQTFL